MKNRIQTKRNSIPSVAFVAFVASVAFPASKALCAFEAVGNGARPGAMANAFTAIGGDVHSIFFNPSGLGLLRQPELTSMYSKLFMGLSDKSDIGVSLLGYAQPLGRQARYGQAGLGFWKLQLDSLFSEQAVSLAWGRSLHKADWAQIHGGLAVKQLTRSYGTTPETSNAINLAGTSSGKPDPVFAQGRSKNAISFDLGMLVAIGDNYSVGLAAQNINQPNMALESSADDPVPMNLKAGAAVRALKSRFSADFTRRESIKGVYDHALALGAEKTWPVAVKDSLAFRAGFLTGSRNLRQVAMGLGYQFSRLSLNYALQIPLTGISDTSGNHQLSLSFRFGQIAQEEADLERLLQNEQRARENAERELSQAIAARLEAERKLISLAQQMQAAGASPDANLETLRRQMRQTEQEKEKRKTAEVRARRSLEAAYKLSWNFYQRKTAAGAGLTERIEFLKRIIAKYSPVDIDLIEPKLELTRLLGQQQVMSEELKSSWDYYTQVTAQGASPETRAELLQKILKKFQGQGIDVTIVEKELKNLEKK
ncbi:MAG: type IX secretion system membrane protein PorP/SprF [Elusimicrobia bacterium]|nr:type IX secretion system membrane protein PorP/SprF [Elusimicrobiota bacterium]